MTVRLGELLVSQGVLTRDQLDSILETQKRTGRPLGLLAEQMFNIDPEVIEDAWAEQYGRLTRTVDPGCEVIEQRILELVTRRQAWQFRILPMRIEDGVLVAATTTRNLRRALRFASRIIDRPCYFLMSAPRQLGEALCRYYPLPGMTPCSIEDDCLDQQFRSVRENCADSAANGSAWR